MTMFSTLLTSTARRSISGKSYHRYYSFLARKTPMSATATAAGNNIRVHQRYRRSASTTSSTTGSSDQNMNLTVKMDDPYCNVPPHIAKRVEQTPKLYQRPPHPLTTIKQQIYDYFGSDFVKVENKSPIVTTNANFDSLLIPPDHVSRSKSDTYYLTPEQCLRCHTSAHQVELLNEGHTKFLCTGDVYRRDDIDKTHYPIFHQMEGVKVFTGDEFCDNPDEVLQDLRDTLQGLAHHLFGPVECRWVDEYFPFTHPSLELEIYYQDEWLEVLGCGVMRPGIHQLPNNTQAWAFGLGLERLAMILFDIPDIRLFWSEDDRFWKQFTAGEVSKFQPYSKYPPCFKDVSFWIMDEEAYDSQDLLDMTRQVAGDIVENVHLVDEFVHPKTKLESKCFRITYRSMDRSLTNAEVDVLQEELRSKIQEELPIELR